MPPRARQAGRTPGQTLDVLALLAPAEARSGEYVHRRHDQARAGPVHHGLPYLLEHVQIVSRAAAPPMVPPWG